MSRQVIIRNHCPEEAPVIDALAVSAFDQFSADFADGPAFRKMVAHMSSLSQSGELIVAEQDGCMVGAVAYLGPGKPKAAYFRPEWAVMRMLVVAPAARGQGIGRALTEECLRRASRDGASCLALHTSKLMRAALSMYLRLGFEWQAPAPSVLGVDYDVYAKDLALA